MGCGLARCRFGVRPSLALPTRTARTQSRCWTSSKNRAISTPFRQAHDGCSLIYSRFQSSCRERLPSVTPRTVQHTPTASPGTVLYHVGDRSRHNHRADF